MADKRPGLTEQDATLWWDRIAFIPSIHGRAAFARETRRVFLAERFPTVAVELPESLADKTLQGIDLLPEISVVSYEEADGTRCFFPIDPCDSIIEGLRLGRAENCHLEFIDCDVENFERQTVTLPDPYAVHSIGLARYYRTVQSKLPVVEPDSQEERRECYMAIQLHELLSRHDRHLPVLCIVGMSHLAGILRHLQRFAGGRSPEADRHELLQALPPFQVDLHPLSENSLYHILGEFPYVTYLWEEQRHAITLEEFDSTEKLKDLLLVARERFHDKHAEEFQHISTTAFQNLLKLTRNLCLLQKRLTPSLYEVVLAARGIGGDEFAMEVIRMAKRYPPLRDEPPATSSADAGTPAAPADSGDVPQGNSPAVEPSDPALDSLPDEYSAEADAAVDMTEEAMRTGADVVPAKKRYIDESKEWKKLKLVRPPSKEETTKWRTAWNPYETCSWEPEDQLIENFAAHVRQKALRECGLAQERLEEFTTSFKDGLHVRETLRNYHLGKIFVKEVPPVRGQVGAVVIVYDKPNPDKYPWKLTWFSEHEWESTLSFYATDYRRELVGPGIGRALYGGQLFLYPPRVIVDVWEDPAFATARDDEERLVFAALCHSRERFVAYSSPTPPTLRMKLYAEKRRRRLVYLPLSSFSRSTIQKLRRFHVLNGKPVRSYARQFIR